MTWGKRVDQNPKHSIGIWRVVATGNDKIWRW